MSIPDDSEFQASARSILAVIVILLVGSVANSAGVGGGAIFIPVLQALVGFGLKPSTALSQALIAAGSCISVALNSVKPSPLNPNEPLINVRLALVFTPMVLVGVGVGVVLNRMLPPWLLSILLVLLMCVLVLQAWGKATHLWRQENKQRQQQRLAAASNAAEGAASTLPDLPGGSNTSEVSLVRGPGSAKASRRVSGGRHYLSLLDEGVVMSLDCMEGGEDVFEGAHTGQQHQTSPAVEGLQAAAAAEAAAQHQAHAVLEAGPQLSSPKPATAPGGASSQTNAPTCQARPSPPPAKRSWLQSLMSRITSTGPTAQSFNSMAGLPPVEEAGDGAEGQSWVARRSKWRHAAGGGAGGGGHGDESGSQQSWVARRSKWLVHVAANMAVNMGGEMGRVPEDEELSMEGQADSGGAHRPSLLLRAQQSLQLQTSSSQDLETAAQAVAANATGDRRHAGQAGAHPHHNIHHLQPGGVLQRAAAHGQHVHATHVAPPGSGAAAGTGSRPKPRPDLLPMLPPLTSKAGSLITSPGVPTPRRRDPPVQPPLPAADAEELLTKLAHILDSSHPSPRTHAHTEGGQRGGGQQRQPWPSPRTPLSPDSEAGSPKRAHPTKDQVTIDIEPEGAPQASPQAGPPGQPGTDSSNHDASEQEKETLLPRATSTASAPAFSFIRGASNRRASSRTASSSTDLMGVQEMGVGAPGARRRTLSDSMYWAWCLAVAVFREIGKDLSRIPGPVAGAMTGMWALFVALQVARSQVVRCSGGYWGLLATQLGSMLFLGGVATAWSRKVLRKRVQSQAGPSSTSTGHASTGASAPATTIAAASSANTLGDGLAFLQGSLKDTLVVLAVCTAAGLVGGMLGLGGGMVIGPLLLQMKVHPQMAAATSTLIVLFSSSAALTAFAVLGQVNKEYGLVLGAASVVGSLLGVFVMTAAVRRTGRTSVVVFSMCGFMITGLVCVGIFGLIDIRSQLKNGVGFRSVCDTA